MMNVIARTVAPDVSAEQKALDRTRKHLCKLRWIGRESDAERMLVSLRAAGSSSPARGETRRRGPAAEQAEDLIA
jgi:hypothetical protein